MDHYNITELINYQIGVLVIQAGVVGRYGHGHNIVISQKNTEK
jgi:hypothetical protein